MSNALRAGATLVTGDPEFELLDDVPDIEWHTQREQQHAAPVFGSQ